MKGANSYFDVIAVLSNQVKLYLFYTEHYTEEENE